MQLYSPNTFLPQHFVPLQTGKQINHADLFFSFTWKKASITELNFRGKEESQKEKTWKRNIPLRVHTDGAQGVYKDCP